jgi:hypothetical protein
MAVDLSAIDFGPIVEMAKRLWRQEKYGECRPDQYRTVRRSCIGQAIRHFFPPKFIQGDSEREYLVIDPVDNFNSPSHLDLIRIVEELMGPY